jgi:TFIIF-interacting CTD phosphatase-like protein
MHLRPGLREFLRKLTQLYETHIFTAALPSYADPQLDHLDPHGELFAGRWYCDSCIYWPSRGAYVKSLLNLPIFFGRGAHAASNCSQQHQPHPALRRVVLVDNNENSFLTNPDNGILVSSFESDPSDVGPDGVWLELWCLEGVDDVRPHVKSAFGLDQMLAEQ